MPLYLCRRWRGSPRPREGQTLAWVRPDKLADYPMPAADRRWCRCCAISCEALDGRERHEPTRPPACW